MKIKTKARFELPWVLASLPLFALFGFLLAGMVARF
jgi:hypothetical protein